MELAIRTRRLTKRFGHHTALSDLNLDVPAGIVFGYLGPNGAGKTTTIRLLAGLIRPTAGSAIVFGFDAADSYDVLQQRIGYLPGDFVPYPDLTATQYLRYFANLRGGVDQHVVDALVKRFDLDVGVKIRTLSHGNRQKVGIIQAFMHEPELLILDEPTAGLDPIMQREFLTLLRESRDAGRTVFLSSHILSEVEAIADQVAILRRGNLVTTQSIEALKAQTTRRIELTFAGPPPVDLIRGTPGVQRASADDLTAHVVVTGSTAPLLKAIAPYEVTNLISHETDLESIFLDYYAVQR